MNVLCSSVADDGLILVLCYRWSYSSSIPFHSIHSFHPSIHLPLTFTSYPWSNAKYPVLCNASASALHYNYTHHIPHRVPAPPHHPLNTTLHCTINLALHPLQHLPRPSLPPQQLPITHNRQPEHLICMTIRKHRPYYPPLPTNLNRILQ